MSNRKYKVAISDKDGIAIEGINIKSLLDDNQNDNKHEWVYAMQDITDKILDLQINESMYFNPNRDDVNSKGIIFRMS